MNKEKLLNILLLPKSIYNKISDNRVTLILGILLIGIKDIFLPLNNKFLAYFWDRAQPIVIFNATLVLLAVVLIGLMDAAFFAYPLADLMQLLRFGKKGLAQKRPIIRLIKFYIVAHFVIIPVDILIELIDKMVNFGAYPQIGLVAGIILLLTPLWFTGVITRGILVLYKFEERFRGLVFMSILLWNVILSVVLNFVIQNGIFPLFK